MEPMLVIDMLKFMGVIDALTVSMVDSVAIVIVIVAVIKSVSVCFVLNEIMWVKSVSIGSVIITVVKSVFHSVFKSVI